MFNIIDKTYKKTVLEMHVAPVMNFIYISLCWLDSPTSGTLCPSCIMFDF